MLLSFDERDHPRDINNLSILERIRAQSSLIERPEQY
jgi:hypothetical protein